jgi:hypothetical protein
MPNTVVTNDFTIVTPFPSSQLAPDASADPWGWGLISSGVVWPTVLAYRTRVATVALNLT